MSNGKHIIRWPEFKIGDSVYYIENKRSKGFVVGVCLDNDATNRGEIIYNHSTTFSKYTQKPTNVHYLFQETVLGRCRLVLTERV